MFAHIHIPALEAQVERLCRPWERAPVVVVSRGSVISAWPQPSGIPAATTAWEARLRRPQARLVPANPDKYAHFWQRALQIASDYSPDLHEEPGYRVSLDLSGTELLFGAPANTARCIAGRIGREGLQARIGIGKSRILARIAAHSCENGAVEMTVEKMDLLPIEALPGLNERVTGVFRELGIEKVRDLRRIPRFSLIGAFGAQGEALVAMLQGRDCDETGSRSIERRTILHPVVEDKRVLRAVVAALAEALGRELRQQGLAARKVRAAIALRTSRESVFDGEGRAAAQVTFTRTLESATAGDDDLLRAVSGAVGRCKHPVRAISLAALRLCEQRAAGQLPLPGSRAHLVHKALDAVKDRHGELALTRASAAVHAP